MPYSVIVKLFIGSFTYLDTCGDEFPSSFVNTELNWLTNNSALRALSLTSFPEDSKGPTI